VYSKDKKHLISLFGSPYLCFIRSAIKGWLGQQGRGNAKSARRRQRQKSAPDNQVPQGAGSEGESRSDNAERQRERRPAGSELKTGKLNQSKDGHAERDSTPRRKDRKEPEPKVSQITVAWRKPEASATGK